MDKKLFYCQSLAMALLLGVVAGCSKSDSETKSPAVSPPPAQPVRTVARLHWLGKKRLAAESNATNLMTIWNLPESAKLEAQTLDKLSTAPWRLLSLATSLSNAPTDRLRPLLDDLVREESYLEVQAATNQPGALVLALRLDATRAALWQTNLPIVLQSVFGSTRVPSAEASDFRLQAAGFDFSLSCSGEWMLLSFSRNTNAAPTMLTTFRDRIAATQTPWPPRATNFWLEADLDLRAFGLPGSTLGLQHSMSTRENLPEIKLTLIGDGQNVRTRGELDFFGRIPIEMEPWNIPTNLVHDPLIGFIAIRGIRPWLKSLSVWDETSLGNPPNQAFFWAQDGLPALRFFALPSTQASNHLHQLSEFLVNQVNPLFASSSPTNGFRYGAFERVPDATLLRWRGVPYIAPHFDVIGVGENPFVTGGLFRSLSTNHPAPAELFKQFEADTNLVFYDWEVTQPCENGLIQLSQLARLVFGRARLSITNNAALPWLVAISPKLGVAGTSIRLADANRLTFSRSSTLGLTGVELHLLADWLESPDYPKGLFTLDAKPIPPMTLPAQPLPTVKP